MRRTISWLVTTGVGAWMAVTPMWAQAQSTSSSATYTVLHAPAGNAGGGGPVSNASGSVTAEVSTGDAISGEVSQVTAGGVEQKGNLVGQLYDENVASAADVEVSADPETIGEELTRQLFLEVRMDDDTMLALPPGEAGWEIVSGPLTGIDVNGLASAGFVFEDTVATVRGTHLGFDDDLSLTVLNVEADNYLEYAGDRIDDDWQVNYFGEPPNEAAGAKRNPDGDPNDNLFEFLGGFDPTDAADYFRIAVLGFSGTETFEVDINKVMPGRTYTLYESTDLKTFTSIGSFNVPVVERHKVIRDTNATVSRKLYRIEIAKP